MAKDVATFLNWAAEPEHDERKKIGIKAVILFSTLTAISLYVKRFKWSVIKNRKIGASLMSPCSPFELPPSYCNAIRHPPLQCTALPLANTRERDRLNPQEPWVICWAGDFIYYRTESAYQDGGLCNLLLVEMTGLSTHSARLRSFNGLFL